MISLRNDKSNRNGCIKMKLNGIIDVNNISYKDKEYYYLEQVFSSHGKRIPENKIIVVTSFIYNLTIFLIW